MADLSHWQFWVDVGGTFTDCLALGPDGEIRSCKVLSSGVYKGRCSGGDGRTAVEDGALPRLPDGFFGGYVLRVLDAGGETAAETRVTASAGGRLDLDPPLAAPCPPGAAFELSSGEKAPLVAVRRLLGLGLDVPLAGVDLKLGTTRGTNALLERTGAKTALITTAGFEDFLSIGTQDRPSLFARRVVKPAPLYHRAYGVPERVAADGSVLEPLDEAAARRLLARARDEGCEALALCLLNSYRNPVHEDALARLARDAGFRWVSVSSGVSPSIKMVPRGHTTVVDAYLTPVVRRYLEDLAGRLDGGRVRVMTSAGGLSAADRFAGRESVLSGPAGGVVGFARVAREEGVDKAIGFDMGGTSTDVARFDGRYEMQYETEKAGVHLAMPMLAIETVAAGGGSICSFDGERLLVGPQSAGADPGPACYGRGGPLTVTDVNLYLGRIAEERFPFSLDREAVARRLAELAGPVARATGRPMEPVDLALGLRRIADANMAAPIRKISTARGIDVREYALVAFGGAGPQHAASVARLLGVPRILLHPYGGVLSALGIGTADVRRFRQQPVLAPLTADTPAALEPAFRAMEQALTAEVRAEGVAPESIAPPRRLLEVRYQGEGSTLTVAARGPGGFAAAFQEAHEKVYGHAYEDRPMEAVSARVEVTGETGKPAPLSLAPAQEPPRPVGTATVSFEGWTGPVPLFERRTLRPGHRIDGPALVVEDTSTIVVEPGWELDTTVRGNLLLTDRRGAARREEVGTEADPVMLEIFHNHFASIAERMGEVLRRTAFSTNVKERLDFSCAVFDGRGGLVANAPHIPVHLGAMGETVAHLLAAGSDLRKGDVYLTNDPACGGSHLPDLTVMTPVLSPTSGEVVFFTACRAHHAEIGGLRPGSMPPDSRRLSDEGVVFRNFLLVRDGALRREALLEALAGARHPSRQPRENLADLEAQIAANRAGARDVLAMVGTYGLDTVSAYMGHIQAAAESRMRSCLERLPDGTHRFEDALDDGHPLAVAVTVEGTDAVVDFSGTGGEHPGNFNAGGGVARAAVLYCFRLLLEEDIPLNQGVLAPVRIVVPPGLLNPERRDDPAASAAVAAGNVETSQRVVDVVLGALGVAAASQGTMNNLAFGDDTFSYYETLCGGVGAGPGFHGASAVHSHMTNTRLTDPEVLEARCPVRLVRFGLRGGSGGAGRWRGGDGVVREIAFLRDVEVSVISSRRTAAPYGLAGGAPGQPGRNLLHRAGRDEAEALPSVCTVRAKAGDRFVMETPGGGGYGEQAQPSQ